ncbi:MAG: tRNA (guanine6-N2)-methyltransferase [Archaeoglobi archaeon]|nr:class I SAM-dependent RNA methyltransferase [Candidatus Mnemosynella bozhongmuii]MDI3502496.1 tRNA (guanine6-N2)-methyltransferase [Archaeoglobi archaeon]MDK2781278.1 tRNA (guanine6-N2)-methyltransferase [Archaeoglobi archaeon]
MATSVQGLEDIVAGEIEELTNKRAHPERGRVEFEGSLREMYRVNLRSRCANRVFLILEKERVESLQDIYRVAKGVDYSQIISEEQSFAVRAKRVGEHQFRSPDIASEIGRAVIESFRDSTGKRLRVNLDEPDVEIHALLRDDELIISVNTTGESLHKRGYRRYQHHAPIKPTLGASLIRMSGWSPSESLLDPMCGSGTIPIEAVLMALKVKHQRDFAFERLKIHDEELFKEELSREVSPERPEKIVAMDISPKNVDGARENAESAGVLDKIEFMVGDAKRLDELIDFTPEFVVVNPPYGIRSSRKGAIKELYESFLLSLERISDDTTLVLITAAEKEFRESLEKTRASEVEERFVLYGDLPARVFKVILG